MIKSALRYRQFIFFLAVGVGTLAIDVVVTTSLFRFGHLPSYLASSIGFLSGFVFNFPMNRKKVFHHSDLDRHSLRVQVVLYVMLSLFNLITTSGMVYIFVDGIGIAIQYAKLMVTGIIAIWNFTLFKYVIFSKRNEKN